MVNLSSHKRAGHVARMGARRTAYSILGGNPEGKKSFGRPKCSRVGNIKMDLIEIEWGGMYCTDQACKKGSE
jgi:hypothetical protein